MLELRIVGSHRMIVRERPLDDARRTECAMQKTQKLDREGW